MSKKKKKKKPSKKKSSTGLVSVPSKKKKNKKGKTVDTKKAPKFKKNKYYRKDSVTKAPEFKKNNTWIPLTSDKAPKYVANKYYSLVRVDRIAPKFTTGDIYKMWLDHYANMIMSARDHIENLQSSDSQNIDLSEFDADIGDIVGGEDYMTGAIISEPITNIIVKCKNGIESFEYVVGGENE